MNLELHSPARRKLYKIGLFGLLIIVILLAATIPFVWESKTMWYKFGMDRTLLRAGKIAGLCTAILIFCQIFLVLKLKFLDRTLGLDRLYHLHKQCGLTILVFAAVHASLILIPEGLENLPIGWKFWPEMLGGTVLLLLFAFIGTALFHKNFMPYHIWRAIHRPMGYIFAIALTIHIFNVSDSFAENVPNYALWSLCVITTLIVMFSKIRSFCILRNKLEIRSCSLANDDILNISIASPKSFCHAPGQFAFLRLHGKNISPELHPFTIASAPDTGSSDDVKLQFFIKKCGDWTKRIQPEEITQASIQGPFGLFSYKANPPADQIVFIAGGIGITPIMSMLRHLGQEEKSHKVMLIWCVSQKKDVFLR